MLLGRRRFGCPNRLREVVQHSLDEPRHSVLGDETAGIQLADVDSKPTLELLLLGPRQNRSVKPCIVGGRNNRYVARVVEGIKHARLGLQVLEGVGVSRRDVSKGIRHQSGEEGLPNASVKQQGSDPQAEEVVSLLQLGENLSDELGIRLLGQLVQHRTDLVVVRVVLLANLANHVHQGRLTPIGLGNLPAGLGIRLAIQRLEGDLELGNDLVNVLSKRRAGIGPSGVNRCDVHGNAYCPSERSHFRFENGCGGNGDSGMCP